MKDAISKKKGPDAALSRKWHQAYRHNTVKARRQDGRRVVERQGEDSMWQDKPLVPALHCGGSAAGQCRLVVVTQYLENYGAHAWDGEGQCPQYWKAKGGSEYVIYLTLARAVELGAAGLSRLVSQAAARWINKSNDYAQEWVIDWSLLGAGELTQDEQDGACYGFEAKPVVLPFVII